MVMIKNTYLFNILNKSLKKKNTHNYLTRRHEHSSLTSLGKFFILIRLELSCTVILQSQSEKGAIKNYTLGLFA